MEPPAEHHCDEQGDGDDVEGDDATLKTRHSARLAFMDNSRMPTVEYPENLMGMFIPTRPRTSVKMRPRDLRQDPFIAGLVKRPNKGSRNAEQLQVTVDTQEEHEVAEALFCLANIKVDMKSDGRSLASPSSISKRKSRTRKPAGISKRKGLTSRRMSHDDASLSSESGEKPGRTRHRSRKISSGTVHTMFREGGRRVYHPQMKASDQPVRRHVIHQQPTRARQKPQPVRVETTTAERVILNERFPREEDRAAVPEERYLPVAVMDALKGVYGSGLICTISDEPKTTVTPTPVKKLDAAPQVHPIQLKCDERSNESEDGTPVAMPQSNNTRHIYAARLVRSHLEKVKEEAPVANRTLSLSQSRIEDVLKNLQTPIVQETSIPRQFCLSLPMPTTIPTFSMSHPSLPQSLIQTLQNSASRLASIPTRFPPLSGHPPPLVRASEPWETNR